MTSENIEKYLGVKRFRYGQAEEHDQVGQVTGLAWTEVGGELLTIETAVMPGKGKHNVTGQLGDVMKESSEIAWSYLNSAAHKYAPGHGFFEKSQVHIHIPEGATPKDGPSAGVTMTTALISLLLPAVWTI